MPHPGAPLPLRLRRVSGLALALALMAGTDLASAQPTADAAGAAPTGAADPCAAGGQDGGAGADQAASEACRDQDPGERRLRPQRAAQNPERGGFEGFAVAGGVSGLYTDNLAGTAEGEEASAYAPQVAVVFAQRRHNWRANIEAAVQQLIYDDERFEDETVPAATALLGLESPGADVEWILANPTGQAVVDPLAANNPENRETVSSTLAGPVANFQPFERTQIQLGAFAGDYRRLDEGDSSRRWIGQAAIVRQVRPTIWLGLEGEYLDAQARSEMEEDYNREAAYVTGRAVGAFTEVEGAVGHVWIETDAGLEDSGTAGWLAAQRELGAHSLRMDLRRDTTDPGFRLVETLGAQARGGPELLSVLTATAQISTSEEAELAWLWSAPRVGTRLGTRWRDENYLDAPFDRKQTRTTLSARYELLPTQTVRGAISRGEITFQANEREDTFDEVGLAYLWRVGALTRLSLEAGYREVESSNPLFNFEETAVALTLVYGAPVAADALTPLSSGAPR